MAERVLRDHSEPCKHYDPVIAGPDPSKDQISGQTYLLGHVVIGSPGGFWCPGGREVPVTEKEGKRSSRTPPFAEYTIHWLESDWWVEV